MIEEILLNLPELEVLSHVLLRSAAAAESRNLARQTWQTRRSKTATPHLPARFSSLSIRILLEEGARALALHQARHVAVSMQGPRNGAHANTCYAHAFACFQQGGARVAVV